MWNTWFSGKERLPEVEPREVELLRGLYSYVRNRLPTSWDVHLLQENAPNKGYDALLTISSPDGARASFIIEAKTRIEPRDVSYLVSRLRQALLPGASPLLVAPFLGPRTRELLDQDAISYADATGNVRLVLNEPPVYIERMGAERNPWREHRALHSLRGAAAGRAVRALCDFLPPYTLSDLAARSRTSPASISRVIGLLEHEALVTRGSFGEVTGVKWRDLIKRWTQDYGLTTSNATWTYLEPRGLDSLLQKLKAATWPYAVTGSLNAMEFAPIAPPRLAVVYVQDHEHTAEHLSLRRAERGANVMLVQPFDTVVFDRITKQGDVTYAAVSQAAADLLTSPGRGPQEGEELLQWMEVHEYVWRT
jgi:hypothetical protein